MKLSFVIVFGVFCAVQAQRGGGRVALDNELRTTTTPVPILRQINKVDEDGSYTYGYEAADGSYKIETKSTNGEVRGKYGYYDDVGQLREIEYGASRQGFHPQGTDVKAPQAAPAMAYDPFDDTGVYDKEKYEKPFAYDHNAYQTQAPQPQQQRRPAAGGRRPGGRRAKQQQQLQQFQQFAPAPQYQPQPQPQPPVYQPQPQSHHVVNYQPAPATPAPPQHNYVNHQQHFQPQAPVQAPFNPAQLFQGHPARNIDINTGSYSVQYHG